MELKKMKKTKSGEYINHYELTYKNLEGKDKIYEMVSREDFKTVEEIGEKAAAVIILAFHENKLLILKEFRMGVNRYVYNFTAGLIEAGETPEEATIREMKEETGLDVVKIYDILPPAFSCTGLTDEKTIFVIAEVEGTFAKSTSANEEIIPYFYTKEEMIPILEKGEFSARTQAVCYFWAYGYLDTFFSAKKVDHAEKVL